MITLIVLKHFIIDLSCCLHTASSQILTYNVNLENLLLMQRGLGWPHELQVAEGNEALLKLSSVENAFENPDHCTVNTPSGVSFDVRQPTSSRYELWGETCGLRVRNITKSDEGRWRLTTSRGNNSFTGWIELYVQEKIPEYSGSPISLQDGQTHAEIELTSLDNSYCLVAQPFSESSLVPGHCRVTLDRTTRAVQGNWNVVLGLPGQVSELKVERKVAVEAERLDVGYVRDTSANKLHLYCNILHTAKNITFCRFQKTTEASGYNVMDGLSDGTHSYYGEGFGKRQCGMTIETASPQDAGTWRCTVGVKAWVGNQVRQQTPMQALIRVAHGTTNSAVRRYIERNIDEPTTIFVQNDMSFTITCRAEVSLTYCWFQHPNGSQYTPVPQVDEDQNFWYSGESLQTGECEITFAHVTPDDAGVWTCHMGPRNELGVEITDEVIVRVTGPLAANKKEITTIVGDTVTLLCHSSNGNRPLNYCRFLTPKFVGVSVDSSVTQDNAILDRFYFTPGKDLDSGDCSLTIDPVLIEDQGEWTCAALLYDETLESRDTIRVYVGSKFFSSTIPQFRADIMGMAIGGIALLLVLGGVVWYKRDKIRNWTQTFTSSSARTDNVSLANISDYTAPRSSESSSSSSSDSTNANNYNQPA
ncbi:hypothetical protein K1T71_005124 [Dendrolimus kikuchii]|uniref:Uncharacterized protein n=1 Tax=Dendrolimus kikuchii TaxID=765133 RepID=A0ACC1D787_9NEOP|nr:hypothetical protein K1T71_005124 [Dendrolimus kikuchii]